MADPVAAAGAGPEPEPVAGQASGTVRRTFGPVVLAGLASAGLAAWAGGHVWAKADPVRASTDALIATSAAGTADVPLAGALALVVLACWGVLLVTSGLARRLVAGLGALVGVAMLATGVLGLGSSADRVRSGLAGTGAEVIHTSWPWIYLVAALLATATAAAAVRLAPTWPAMGSRYDAPGTRREHARPEETSSDADASGIELWKALDAGHDPTADPSPSSGPTHRETPPGTGPADP